MISIQDYDTLTDETGKSYTVYNIWIKGDYATSKRFSELVAFNKAVRWLDLFTTHGIGLIRKDVHWTWSLALALVLMRGCLV